MHIRRAELARMLCRLRQELLWNVIECTAGLQATPRLQARSLRQARDD